MFHHFTDTDDIKISYPIKKYSKFDYIQRQYKLELNRVREYYLERIRAVNNSHMISRLIDILTPSVSLDTFDYYIHVTANAKLVSKQFDIVSNLNYGKVLKNELWEKNSLEIFLYTDNGAIDKDIENNWKTLSPIRVIKNEVTDLNFCFPYEDKEFYVPMLSIYEIDVHELLLQYKFWCMDRMTSDNSTNSNVFVATVVLPNMVNDMLDHAIYNRFVKLINNDDIDEFDKTHPFNTLDYSKGIDKILLNVIKDYRNTSTPIDQLLQTVPMISNESLFDLLHINHPYSTAQSEWVIWLARIGDIVNLHKLLGKKGYRRNSDLFNKLPAIVKTMERRESRIEAMLPEELMIDFLVNIEYIKEHIGSR